MTLPLVLASALAVTAPDGAAVCRVTPPARRRGVAHPLRRHRPPHRRARGMDVRLREGPPLLAREPRAGRVRAPDALRDCLPQAQPPRHGGVSARGGGRRLDGRPRRRGRDRLRPPPLRLGRPPRTAEGRPRRPGVLHRPVRHAVALRPRGEGLRGPRERPARVPGRAERAVPDRRHLLDQAGQGAARLQPQRAGRTRLRGLREAQQLPVRRARRRLVRSRAHGRPAEAERLREARHRLRERQRRGRDPLRERRPAPQEPRRHPRPARLVGRERREVRVRAGGRAGGA